MNQRFRNAEIKRVSERYSENELYKNVCLVGYQLENEMPHFGLCPEECFMETLELLTEIANEGESVLSKVDSLWLRKENEYRRFDRNVDGSEIRKAVGIVFGFAILVIDSSRYPFYRRTLSEQLMNVIANHKWDDWNTTIERIFDAPLSDGWFDSFINEEPIEDKNSSTTAQEAGPKSVEYTETIENNTEIPTGKEEERNEIIGKYDHFIDKVKLYNFLECPKVKCLDKTQKGKLVRKIVNRHDRYGAYAIAMLCELEYDKWMIDNHAKKNPEIKPLTKSVIHKHWADALGLTIRNVIGNYNVIRNPNSKEDKEKYKASEYTTVVHDDYISIKENKSLQ